MTIITINGIQFEGSSLSKIYSKVLKYLVDNGIILRGDKLLPYPTSNKRYFVSKEPVHQRGNSFRIPVEYNGYFLEGHKSWKIGLKHLGDFLKKINVGVKINHCEYEHY